MNDRYVAILKTGYMLQQASKNGMILCQSWGYNGFKRLLRRLNRHLNNLCLLVENEMFDHYQLVAPLQHNANSYSAFKPTDIKDFAHAWDATMKDACAQLALDNIALIGHTGIQSCLVKALIKCVLKHKEKAHRFLKRGDEVQWMAHDLHVYDDMLHEKVKCLEEKELEHWEHK